MKALALLFVAVLATALRAPAQTILDFNDNGMPDLWERHFNGGVSFSSSNPGHHPEADPDGDGFDNLAESEAGTDPFSGEAPGGFPGIAVVQHPDFPHVFLVQWHGVAGKHYQLSGSPGLEGYWIAVGEPSLGTGGPIVQVVEVEDFEAAPRYFWKLDVGDIDRDGDGLEDAGEALAGTDPLAASSSGTGITDAWAIAHGLDPNDPSIGGGTFGGTGMTNLEAQQSGVQAHPDATPEDRDGDGLGNDEDADPDDRVIDWNPGPRPVFAVVELPVTDLDDLWFNDLSPDGTVLLARGANPVQERIVIDRNREVHTFTHGNPAVEGAFGSAGYALIGDKVPGHRSLPGGSNQECQWDPGDNSFTAWQWTGAIGGHHDEIRDDRDGVTAWIGAYVADNQLAFGLRTWPGGELLPGSLALQANGATDARIEESGNIVSNWAYWRWSGQNQSFSNPAKLPDMSWLHSATLSQPPAGIGTSRVWNLVAGVDGLMVAKDGGRFRMAEGSLGSSSLYGVTAQGWAWRGDGEASSIWANGQWHDLKDCLGDADIAKAELWDILDTGLGVARIEKTGGAETLALLVPLEVMELAPKTIDGKGNEIDGSEKPSVRGPLCAFVEENPDEDRIAHREIQVEIGRFFQGKKVTWSLEPVPGATPAAIRGNWEDSPTHPDRFEASASYGAHGFNRLSQTLGETTVAADGRTAVRVNVPPIGFNRARIKALVDGASSPAGVIDLEVPGVVVIDPGHGGNDPGAVGAGGIQEKDLALAYGLKLSEELVKKFKAEGRGLRVVMTRATTEGFLEPADRALKAKDEGTDVLVSIHFNSAQAAARGTETFIERTAEEASPGNPGDNKNVDEDETLATALNTTTLNAVAASDPGAINRGVKRAGKAVTRDGPAYNGNTTEYHPVKACLIEVEFLSNAAALETVKLTNASGTAIRDAFALNAANDIFINIRDQQ